MSDDRFTREPDDEEEANSHGERPYLDVPPPGVRRAPRNSDRLGPPTPEEIEEFIAKEFGDTKAKQKRPAPEPAARASATDPAEDFER